MPTSNWLDRYLAFLQRGERRPCREIAAEALAAMPEPAHIYEELLWPAMTRIEALYRDDRINTATERMATRINRTIADQMQMHLRQQTPNGRQVIIACPNAEPEELGAQMLSDLLESRGWRVFFLGGGVPSDEVLTLVGQVRPEILLIYGTQPSGVPEVRRLVELIREVGVQATMNIIVSGGVFNRADGLWREVNADHFAEDIGEAVELIETVQPRKPDARVDGTPRKRRRRRRSNELEPVGT